MRRTKNTTKTAVVRLHLFIDRSSVELFVNDDEAVMTSRVYPKEQSTIIELFANGGEARFISFTAWKLNDTMKK
ncbi:GH32 C-terminal domain-containing protein [Domibacillus tundrae]|uniref:GH32 C-terminal domain-containing protein n=1 Tax=Domibacillus tundrae TaxID=1587527 RepID=UPI001FDEC88F|nr:GH32 C-terminal domain-containing protein [Domibacillus tundrae]